MTSTLTVMNAEGSVGDNPVSVQFINEFGDGGVEDFHIYDNLCFYED